MATVALTCLTARAPAVSAQLPCPGPPAPSSRTGRIAAGNAYLRSLVTHDTDGLPLAPDVVRTENGAITAVGAAAICRGNADPGPLYVITGIRGLRWYVDGDHAISFYLLDTLSSPTYIVERFEVVDGLVRRIEAVFYIDVSGYALGPESGVSRPEGVGERLFAADHGPLGPFAPANRMGETAEPAASSCGRPCVEGAARAYLDALASHDPWAVPLAGEATRRENRRPRGNSGEEIRAALKSPAMQSVRAVQDVTVYAEGEQAVAFYRIESDVRDPVWQATGMLPEIWAATRFRVIEGQILEIESVCWASEFCGARGDPWGISLR